MDVEEKAETMLGIWVTASERHEIKVACAQRQVTLTATGRALLLAWARGEVELPAEEA